MRPLNGDLAPGHLPGGGEQRGRRSGGAAAVTLGEVPTGERVSARSERSEPRSPERRTDTGVDPHMFTIGHGARELPAFLAVLGEASVSVVVDVRRFPGSRHHPQFGRRLLERALAEAGIGYEWQGEPLGGRRARLADTRHPALLDAALAGYADHMDTAEFREAVEALVSRAGAGERPVVMCAETRWWQCHRMLVADALEMRGATVVHLMEVGRRERYRPHATVRRGEDGWPVYDVPDTLPS
jgi:hypothetical protein